MKTRIEKDTIGDINVEVTRLWGAQTQRSLENFKIGTQKMPIELIYSYAYLKKACAIVNNDYKSLSDEKKDAIVNASEEIIAKKYDDMFPLSVWQTGSGTQTNMNLNEVIANLATIYLGGDFIIEKLVHPNDEVNMSQSSNDTFPTAMKIAILDLVENKLLPAIKTLLITFDLKQKEFANIIKIGRTHLQDATPLTLGQEFSGYVYMLKTSYRQIKDTLKYIAELPIGGTAVGTGINSYINFGEKVCAELNKMLDPDVKFVSSPNKFHGLTSHDAEVNLSGALNALASNLMKIANDIRWLSSGPRCAIGEIKIPENEPGSSIMPGKVNPTQSEALTMIAAQVMGNHTTISIAASGGNFELNVFKPVIIHNIIESINLLSEGIISFNDNCIIGVEANESRIKEHLDNSLMLVTALNKSIGYEKAAQIAKSAYKNCTTLEDEAIKSGFVTKEQFKTIVNPSNMINPKI